MTAPSEFSATKRILYKYFDSSQNISVSVDTIKPRINSVIKPNRTPELSYLTPSGQFQIRLNRGIIGMSLDSSFFPSLDSSVNVSFSQINDTSYNLTLTANGEFVASKTITYSYLESTFDISFNVDTVIPRLQSVTTPQITYLDTSKNIELTLSKTLLSDLSPTDFTFPDSSLILTSITKDPSNSTNFKYILKVTPSGEFSATKDISYNYRNLDSSSIQITVDTIKPRINSFLTQNNPLISYLNPSGSIQIGFSRNIINDTVTSSFFSNFDPSINLQTITYLNDNSFNLTFTASGEYTSVKKFKYSYLGISSDISFNVDTVKPKLQSVITSEITYLDSSKNIQLTLSKSLLSDLVNTDFTFPDSSLTLNSVTKDISNNYILNITSSGEYSETKDISYNYRNIDSSNIQIKVNTIKPRIDSVLKQAITYLNPSGIIQLKFNRNILGDLSASFFTNFESGIQLSKIVKINDTSYNLTLTASGEFTSTKQFQYSYLENTFDISIDVDTVKPRLVDTSFSQITYLDTSKNIELTLSKSLLSDLITTDFIFPDSSLNFNSVTKDLTNNQKYILNITPSGEYNTIKDISYNYRNIDSSSIRITVDTIKPRIVSILKQNNPLISYLNPSGSIQIRFNRNIIDNIVTSSFFSNFDSSINLQTINHIGDNSFNLILTASGEFTSTKNFKYSYLGISSDISFNVDTIKPKLQSISSTDITYFDTFKNIELTLSKTLLSDLISSDFTLPDSSLILTSVTKDLSNSQKYILKITPSGEFSATKDISFNYRGVDSSNIRINVDTVKPRLLDVSSSEITYLDTSKNIQLTLSKTLLSDLEPTDFTFADSSLTFASITKDLTNNQKYILNITPSGEYSGTKDVSYNYRNLDSSSIQITVNTLKPRITTIIKPTRTPEISYLTPSVQFELQFNRDIIGGLTKSYFANTDASINYNVSFISGNNYYLDLSVNDGFVGLKTLQYSYLDILVKDDKSKFKSLLIKWILLIS